MSNDATKSKKFPTWYFFKSIAEKSISHVDIGILSADFKKPKKDAEAGVTIGEVAIIQEFGTDRIPARSFLRSTVKEKRTEWRKFAKDQINLCIKGTITEKQLLDRLGLKIQADIKNKIIEGIPPPLSPITIELRRKKRGKASTKPLIDTGQLLNSIQYQVVLK